MTMRTDIGRSLAKRLHAALALSIILAASNASALPLHEADAKGDAGEIRALLNAGAKIEARDKAIWTPLP